METHVMYNNSLTNFNTSSGANNNGSWLCRERGMHMNQRQILNLPAKRNHLKMIAGSLYIPKENDKRPQGEDAHFICVEKQTFGVADGVGGWSKVGIDAGEYARELMTNSFISIHSQTQGIVDPEIVLSEAYSHTRVEGSSTACILTLNKDVINAVNIGDSGFMIIRDWKVVYHSPIQQRSFNCPYQLGICKDDPSDAQLLRVEVELGDIIIAGTDGLFDNMDQMEIEEIVDRRIKEGANPEQLASMIANYALYNSFDRFAETPFSRASRKAGISHSGGKVDDITVIVAFVVLDQ